MRKKAIFLLVVGVLLIVGGLVVSFASSFAKDVKTTQENVLEIEENYSKFKELLESFNGERELVYSDIFNNMYVENVESSYNSWISLFNSYEKVTDNIYSYKDFLSDRCLGIYYNDTSVQSKCDSMMISLETASNYYVKDINKFNEFLKLYNDTLQEEEKISYYDLKKYKYIDFDDDGKYLGK